MSSRTKDALSSTDRELQRQKYQAKIAVALKEADDPLAIYHQFVQWTIKNYGERDPKSGLVELLKEATAQFKEDSLYKTDLRYLKIWALYARQMDKAGAISIYAYLVDHDIGTSYSALYEDYANLLEVTNRRQDADKIYRKGIAKSARPVERLKMRYREFQTRGPSSSSASPSTSSPQISDTRGHAKSSPSSSSATPAYSGTFKSTAAERYALMLAPPAPGKRPEKLRFNMSLLFTEEGAEYSIQEARARSMGLLGKKWGPLPPGSSPELSKGMTGGKWGSAPSGLSPESSPTSSASSSLEMVDFNDDGQKSSRLKPGGRRSIMGGAEPTVTINTKEALADVFGMYNSPDKTMKLGSKHAPVKKVEPITPAIPPRITFSRENENADRQNAKTPTPAFRPFTDENAQPNQSRTPAAKFTPFVDANQQKTPFTTPRTVLTVKEVPPPSGPRSATESDAEEKNTDPVYAKVFTPASKGVPLAPLRDVFTDDHGKPIPKTKTIPTHERARSHDVSSLQADAVRSSAFTPFKGENSRAPFKVFSRPPEQGENAHIPAPKTPSAAFKPFSDHKPPAFTPFKDVTPAFKPLAEAAPKPETGLYHNGTSENANVHPSSSHHVVEVEDNDEAWEPVEPELEQRHDLDEEDGEQYYEEEEDSQIEEEFVPLAAEHLPEEYEEENSYQDVPLGGRFGQFNVMTPITERTFEFTSSTRGGTPSERYSKHRDDGQQAEYQAARAAALLAEELRESDEEAEEEHQELEPLRLSVEQPPFQGEPDVVIIEERVGSLSLLDTLTLSSKFRPSNPCNPFDPAILSSLITRIPADPYFYDLRTQQSNKLAELQKFAKKSRKTSSSSNSGALDSGSFPLILQGHQFMVTEKLGEGGFGCVFKAKDKGVQTVKVEDDEDDEDEDDEDDEDEEASSMVALKVVKPRNVWEYHVLRRLHSALPPALRKSVVLPHALYAYSDESHLVLDLCPQGMLLNIVNNAASAGVAQAGACLDELLVVFFTIELLRLLEAMHNTGFIHGDLKIDNCLLRLEEVPGGAAAWSGTYQPSGDGGWSYKGLKVIDFGRTIDMRLFPPGQQFIADWATDDRDCFEVRENKPWTYQTDYFGLAGIIYCMLFGKYIQANSVVEDTDEEGVSRYKIGTPFKRYWQSDLWNRLFDVLLNPCLVRPDGELPVCYAMCSLRREMEQWLQSNCNRTSNTLKGLLKKVELSCYKM